MKKLTLTTILMCAACIAQAQLRVTANGNVSLQSAETPLSVFKADKIRIGSKVTLDIPEGEYIFKDGRMNLSAKEVTLESGTTVEKGAELYISTDKQ